MCPQFTALAVDLVKLGLQVVEQRWGPDISVVAEVLSGNTASNVCFARAGFISQPINSYHNNLHAVNRWVWKPAA